MTEKALTIPALAEDFLFSFSGKLIYWKGLWWVYRNGFYSEYSDTNLMAKISMYLQYDKEITGKFSSRKVSSIIMALRGICCLDDIIEPPEWLSKDGIEKYPENCRWLAVNNGLFNLDAYIKISSFIGRDEPDPWIIDYLQNNMLLRPTPNFFTLSTMAVNYDPAAKPKLWIKFLSEVLPDIECRFLLQQIFGYCLCTGQPAQAFFIFYGEGANGKSVVLQTLTRMLGKDNVSGVPIELLGKKFASYQMIGKMANIAADMGEVDKLNEGILKGITGGDRLYVERKFKDGITFLPDVKLIFATNEAPSFRDRSDAVWRRLVFLPFPIQIKEAKQNPKLTDELEAEIPAIFNWALIGMDVLIQEQWKFRIPDVCKEALQEHRKSSNPARTFLLEFVENSIGEFLYTSDAYEAYVKYCKDSGYRELGVAKFGGEIARVFGQDRKDIRRPLNSKKQRRGFNNLKMVD